MDLVVVDEPSCRVAAVKLGKEFVGSKSDSSTYPAGCFTIESVFFNPKIDPSSTSPDSTSAGICRPGMVVNDYRV